MLGSLVTSGYTGAVKQGLPRTCAINTFLVLIITVVLIDGMPSSTLLHRKAKALIDPVLDVTGIWQGSWQLFAPNVDKENSRVEALLVFEDGTKRKWTSPDWTQMGLWDRFRHFRHMEYYDSIRMDGNRGAWDALARYLVRNIKHPHGKELQASRVELTRIWAPIPPPKKDQLLPAKPYLRFRKRYRFHTWGQQ